MVSKLWLPRRKPITVKSPDSLILHQQQIRLHVRIARVEIATPPASAPRKSAALRVG